MLLQGQLFSDKLEMETGIAVLAPTSMLRRKGPYRLVYLLHGLCGRSSDFISYSLLPLYAERFHAVFVMPEVERSFYTDQRYGQKFFSYVNEELPCICQNLFQVSASRKDCAVIGVSMGGYGALKCALHAPERFSLCAAFASPCLFFEEELSSWRKNGPDLRTRALFGDQLICDMQAMFGPDYVLPPDCDPAQLLCRVDPQKAPHLHLIWGDRDPSAALQRRFAAFASEHHFSVCAEEIDGIHDWIFFNRALERSLEQWPEQKS